MALLQADRLDEARSLYEQLCRTDPRDAESWSLLGAVYGKVANHAKAAEYLRRSLDIRPNHAETWRNLGVALRELGRLDEAVAAFREALRLQPDYPEAADNLVPLLFAQGRHEEILACYRTWRARHPRDARGHSGLLFSLNYLPDLDPATMLQEHRQWEKAHGFAGVARAFANRRDPERRIRIGYVSRDFRAHSVAYFVEPVLAAHDHAAFEAYCYADVPQPDAMTQRLQSHPDAWRDISRLNDEQVAQVVMADGVDILVDLAGHTKANRLGVFARRAAPVQVAWLGYPNTTGLSTMDYRLTDAVADLPGEEAYYTEKLVRLPDHFLCYRPPEDAPSVGPPPVLQSGHITFGSFNNLSKMNERVSTLWAELLRRVPRARLVLKTSSAAQAGLRPHAVASVFEAHGVAPGRVEFLGRTPGTREHLAQYNRVDIALDTFPYNGVTTTCEALWMGVPVVTLAGSRHVARVSASLLAAAGLSEFIAEDPDDYLARVEVLAADSGRLAALRASLRKRVRTSTLCDAHGFARRFETACRTMWRRWCEGEPS